MLTVYIGYDAREDIAYRVCRDSLLRHASKPVNVQPLNINKLEMQGLMTRPVSMRDGRKFDEISGAFQSTDFATSRFLVGLLQQSGWCIFMDCDMVFTGDVYDILPELDKTKAVQCVQHQHVPTESVKMDGQEQTAYPRKNWSSFFALNADHVAHTRLMISDVNCTPGRDLHAFVWLQDWEIGKLSPRWNWLVDVQPKPDDLRVAHFTLGGPWFPDWAGSPHDIIWQQAYDRYTAGIGET